MEKEQCGTLRTLRLDIEFTASAIAGLNQVFERNKDCLREINLCHSKGIELVIELKWDLLETLNHVGLSSSTFSASFFVSLMGIIPKSITVLSLCAIYIQDSSEDILILPPNIETILLFECHFNSINDMVAQSISKLEELSQFHDILSHIFTSPAYQLNPNLNSLTVYSVHPIPAEKIVPLSSPMILNLDGCNLADATGRIFDLTFLLNIGFAELHFRRCNLDKQVFVNLLIELLKKEQNIIIVEFEEESCNKKKIIFTFPTNGKTIELYCSCKFVEILEHCCEYAKNIEDEELKRRNRRRLQFEARLKVRTEAHETFLRDVIGLIDFDLLSISILPYGTDGSTQQAESEFISFNNESSFISSEPQFQDLIKESFSAIKFGQNADSKSFDDLSDNSDFLTKRCNLTNSSN